MADDRAPDRPGRRADVATARDAGAAVDTVISSLADAAAGLEKAAELIGDDSLAPVLAEMAELRRAAGVRILAAAEPTVGSDEAPPGTVSGALRRGWMQLEAAVAGDGAVVETVKNAQNRLVEDIDRALTRDLPTGVARQMRETREDIVKAVAMLDGWGIE